MNFTSDTRPAPSKPLDNITDAYQAIAALNRVLDRVSGTGALARHIEWAKEAVWAAAYPGSPDDSILNGLEWSADQVE